VEAAAASRIVYGLGWFCLYALWLQRLVGFRWGAVLSIYLRSALASAITVVPALYAVLIWRTPATLGFEGLVFASAASGLCWLGAIVVLRHPARDDLAGMAMHVVGPLRNRLKPRPA